MWALLWLFAAVVGAFYAGYWVGRRTEQAYWIDSLGGEERTARALADSARGRLATSLGK